jgi:hypothetical protein
MRNVMNRPMPIRFVPVAIAIAFAGGALLTSAPAEAQSRRGRGSMEQCVDRVLSQLARSRAPEAAVGRNVVSKCNGPLRATLAKAIASGEAALCSVESCIGAARERAAEEATAAYRQRVRR